MASGDALVNTMRSSQLAFYQQTANLPDAERQAKWSKYLQWAAAQANGSEAQLSSSIPQKRSGSGASMIGMEPGSKRPSIVGPLAIVYTSLV